MFFDDSRPDRRKRAARLAGPLARPQLMASPIPPAKPYRLLSPEELYGAAHSEFVSDTECYVNYWLDAFKSEQTGGVVYFDQYHEQYSINGHIVSFERWREVFGFVMQRYLTVGFNYNKYDCPMKVAALQGLPCWKLKEISNAIIQEGLQIFETEKRFGLRQPNWNKIDIIEVAPISASLKTYAGRLHCELMQDLPYPEDTELTEVQMFNVRNYCVNDLDLTKLLYHELKPQIELRETLGKEYELDLRSKSDAQIAEAVIKSELEKRGVDTTKPEKIIGQTFYYQVPDFVGFKTPILQRTLNTVATTLFEVGETGKANCPEAIKRLKIGVGGCVYQMGNGGLHSSEENASHVADAHTLLIDRDVASYYPQIVLNQGLYPEHLGSGFLEVYQAIVFRRLKAKKDGNKTIADALKITINGAFGKLGSQYSRLYSSDLMSQVTITGQLCLLMLIEAIELAGIPVVSANTDGIVIKCPENRYHDLETVIIAWEERTGFVTEETRYKALYSRDVNNYIAVMNDNEGKCKTKGIYSERGSALNSVLSKNPESLICSDAVQAFLARGVPVADTILACRDIRRFVSVRNVKGGAYKATAVVEVDDWLEYEGGSWIRQAWIDERLPYDRMAVTGPRPAPVKVSTEAGVYLGKSVRWYYAKDEPGFLSYVITGNKVPKSDGAKPLMNLTGSLPADLDFDRYVNEANDMLYDLGYYSRAKKAALF